MKTLKFIDLFAGIGGMRIAAERASKFFKINSKCVFTSEFDQKCVETYNNNFDTKSSPSCAPDVAKH